ncbi:hypothetical protein BDZ94DRAFT_1269186 [Collybia nuda]|uniref:F-box domain-containing protein n=1 Tax=Collybia nuda TaxID=64659 RepID=A0A9P5XWS9_9AGAR|nr:hypothetical protein BDZ94DRAFT_1269186 [Collybia nuda]
MNQMFPISSLPHTIQNNHIPTEPAVIKNFTVLLPVELLGEIFVHCLDFRSDILPIPRKHEAPMLLCRVCARWRHIAMSMPILWATFSAYSPFGVESPHYISLIKFWVEQSRPHPLSFELRAPGSSRMHTFQRSFHLFLSEINRWYDATIELTRISCEQFLTMPLEGDSCLEALTICNMVCTDAQLRRIPTALRQFSQLRRLKITRPLLAPLYDIPWFQLTDINLNTPLAIDECVDILSKCSRIVNCTLTRIRGPSKTIGTHITTLSTLVRLNLCSTCDVGEILSHLTCPALLHLNICYDGWGGTRDPRTFNEFLVRSSSVLETFHFSDEYIMECDLIQYISSPSLRSLKYLSVLGLGASVETLNLFKCDKSGDAMILMPSLESLKLDIEGVPDGLVADIVISRLNPRGSLNAPHRGSQTTLQKVEVCFRCRDPRTLREDEKRLGELKNQGLHVVVHLEAEY